LNRPKVKPPLRADVLAGTTAIKPNSRKKAQNAQEGMQKADVATLICYAFILLTFLFPVPAAPEKGDGNRR
jgi:hypothetical protein